MQLSVKWFHRLFVLLLFSAVWIMNSCANNGSDKTKSAVVKSPFELFADSLPLLELPFYWSSKSDFKHVDWQSKHLPDGAALIGKLPSKNGLHLIIYSYPADIRLPVLEVYDNRGKHRYSEVLVDYGSCPITDKGYYSFRLTNYEVIYKEKTCDSFDSRIERDSLVMEQVVKCNY